MDRDIATKGKTILVIFNGNLLANTPRASDWFVSGAGAAIWASSTDVGDWIDTGETFDLSTALVGRKGTVERVIKGYLEMINNREFFTIPDFPVCDDYAIFIFPVIDMQLLIEVG